MLRSRSVNQGALRGDNALAAESAESTSQRPPPFATELQHAQSRAAAASAAVTLNPVLLAGCFDLVSATASDVAGSATGSDHASARSDASAFSMQNSSQQSSARFQATYIHLSGESIGRLSPVRAASSPNWKCFEDVRSFSARSEAEASSLGHGESGEDVSSRVSSFGDGHDRQGFGATYVRVAGSPGQLSPVVGTRSHPADLAHATLLDASGAQGNSWRSHSTPPQTETPPEPNRMAPEEATDSSSQSLGFELAVWIPCLTNTREAPSHPPDTSVGRSVLEPDRRVAVERAVAREPTQRPIHMVHTAVDASMPPPLVFRWDRLRCLPYLRKWKVNHSVQKQHFESLRGIAYRLTPIGRDKNAVIQRLKQRPPYWPRGNDGLAGATSELFFAQLLGSRVIFGRNDNPNSSSAVQISRDGFHVRSTREAKREGAYGLPLISQGVYRFAFRVSGSGRGLIVGVADAGDDDVPAADSAAWGLHLEHGALYTRFARPQGNGSRGGDAPHATSAARGSLSTTQLLPPVHSAAEETAMIERGATNVMSIAEARVVARAAQQEEDETPCWADSLIGLTARGAMPGDGGDDGDDADGAAIAVIREDGHDTSNSVDGTGRAVRSPENRLHGLRQLPRSRRDSDGELLERAAPVDENSPAIVIEVEVDMNMRSIAFGVAGGPFVRAPNVRLTSCVRPWAYLWNSTDCVSLEARPNTSRNRSRMVSHESLRQADVVRQTRHRSATQRPPVPLRSRQPSSPLLATLPEDTARVADDRWGAASPSGPVLRSGRTTSCGSSRPAKRYNDVGSRRYLPSYCEGELSPLGGPSPMTDFSTLQPAKLPPPKPAAWAQDEARPSTEKKTEMQPASRSSGADWLGVNLFSGWIASNSGHLQPSQELVTATPQHSSHRPQAAVSTMQSGLPQQPSPVLRQPSPVPLQPSPVPLQSLSRVRGARPLPSPPIPFHNRSLSPPAKQPTSLAKQPTSPARPPTSPARASPQHRTPPRTSPKRSERSFSYGRWEPSFGGASFNVRGGSDDEGHVTTTFAANVGGGPTPRKGSQLIEEGHVGEPSAVPAHHGAMPFEGLPLRTPGTAKSSALSSRRLQSSSNRAIRTGGARAGAASSRPSDGEAAGPTGVSGRTVQHRGAGGSHTHRGVSREAISQSPPRSPAMHSPSQLHTPSHTLSSAAGATKAAPGMASSLFKAPQNERADPIEPGRITSGRFPTGSIRDEPVVIGEGGELRPTAESDADTSRSRFIQESIKFSARVEADLAYGEKNPGRNTWRPASVRAMATPGRTGTTSPPAVTSRAMSMTAAAALREQALIEARKQKDARRNEHERSISPRGERPNRPSIVPHMWDVIHFVSRSYSDVYRQL